MQYLKIPLSRWLILPLVLFFIPLAVETYEPNGLQSYYGELRGVITDIYEVSTNDYTPYEKSIHEARLQARIDRLEQMEENPENLQRAISFSMGFMVLNLLCSILWMGLNVRLIQNTKRALKNGDGCLISVSNIMPQLNTKAELEEWAILSLKTFGFWLLAFLGSLGSVWLVFLLGMIGIAVLMAATQILGFIALILWSVYLFTYILLYYVAAQYFYVNTEEVTEGLSVRRNKKFIARVWGKMFKLYGVVFLWSLVFVPLYFVALLSGAFAIGFGLLVTALLCAYFYSFLSALYGKYFYEMDQVVQDDFADKSASPADDLKQNNLVRIKRTATVSKSGRQKTVDRASAATVKRTSAAKNAQVEKNAVNAGKTKTKASVKKENLVSKAAKGKVKTVTIASKKSISKSSKATRTNGVFEKSGTHSAAAVKKTKSNIAKPSKARGTKKSDK